MAAIEDPCRKIGREIPMIVHRMAPGAVPVTPCGFRPTFCLAFSFDPKSVPNHSGTNKDAGHRLVRRCSDFCLGSHGIQRE